MIIPESSSKQLSDYEQWQSLWGKYGNSLLPLCCVHVWVYGLDDSVLFISFIDFQEALYAYTGVESLLVVYYR